MFDDISPRYDFLNHFLSFGVDWYWRRRLVKALPGTLKAPVLDVATGTGDVGFAVRKHHPESTVVGLDYAYGMTRLCHEKINRRQVNEFSVVQGDGEQLPFATHTFSALTISFGFRNIGYYEKALAEFFRVLEPGGRLLILEFATPASRIFSAFYRGYFHTVLPKIAGLFSRSDAYRYLPESVDHFPVRTELESLLSNAGYEKTAIHNLTLGIVTLVSAQKPNQKKKYYKS